MKKHVIIDLSHNETNNILVHLTFVVNGKDSKYIHEEDSDMDCNKKK